MGVERNRNRESTEEVLFTRKQYEYLNKIFPEVVHSSSSTEASIRQAIGNRQVVLYIRDRVQNA